jgi:hypothetical protein
MIVRHVIWIAAMLLPGISGCTWVKLSEGAAAVQVAEIAPAGCELRGKTTVVSRAAVAGVERNESKFLQELETLARNQAVSLGGNLVVADGPVNGNERVFRIFQCPVVP